MELLASFAAFGLLVVGWTIAGKRQTRLHDSRETGSNAA
jgi:hypothetical protein